MNSAKKEGNFSAPTYTCEKDLFNAVKRPKGITTSSPLSQRLSEAPQYEVKGSEDINKYDERHHLQNVSPTRREEMAILDPFGDQVKKANFPEHRRGDWRVGSGTQYGDPIVHESHRFGLVHALWPRENKDYRLEQLRPQLDTSPPDKISRIYCDTYAMDLKNKLQKKDRLSAPITSSKEREDLVIRSSRDRKAIQGKAKTQSHIKSELFRF